jgi:cbb3-type cytochrome oxidase maturation protein
MEILYVIVPLALGFAGFAVWGFIWFVKSGQYDDPKGSAARILLDEDDSAKKTD